jgi:hypothetical protein
MGIETGSASGTSEATCKPVVLARLHRHPHHRLQAGIDGYEGPVMEVKGLELVRLEVGYTSLMDLEHRRSEADQP